MCTQFRQPLLTLDANADALLDSLQQIRDCHDIDLHAGTIMPDHVHLLFELGARISLGQVMAKFKALSNRRHGCEWRWQADGYEHQLRNWESEEDYAFYVFLNPYVAGLVGLSQQWKWWICPDPSRFSFMQHLEGGRSVPKEWIGFEVQLRERLRITE
jgi:putative transposase